MRALCQQRAEGPSLTSMMPCKQLARTWWTTERTSPTWSIRRSPETRIPVPVSSGDQQGSLENEMNNQAMSVANYLNALSDIKNARPCRVTIGKNAYVGARYTLIA